MKLKFEPTIPNILTLLRFFAIPVMAWFIMAGEEYLILSFVIFLAIWLTDMLDGYIARRFNQMTDFGKLFDPLVDKIFQLTLAVMMFLIGRLPLWVPLVLAARELMMVAGSAVLYRQKEMVVYAKWYGKVTTVLFVLAFSALFWIPGDQLWLSGLIFLLPMGWSVFAYIMYGISYVRVISKKES